MVSNCHDPRPHSGIVSDDRDYSGPEGGDGQRPDAVVEVEWVWAGVEEDAPDEGVTEFVA